MYYCKAGITTEVYQEYLARHKCLVDKKFPAAKFIARKYCLPQKDVGVHDLTLLLKEDSAAFQSKTIDKQFKKSVRGWRVLKKRTTIFNDWKAELFKIDPSVDLTKNSHCMSSPLFDFRLSWYTYMMRPVQAVYAVDGIYIECRNKATNDSDFVSITIVDFGDALIKSLEH